MSDIALTADGDLDLTKQRINLVEGEDAIEQNVRIRLQFFFESWFLDLRQGIPFFRDILIKAPNMILVDSLFREAVLSTQGISAVPVFSSTIDTAARQLTIRFAATMDTGETLEFAPFVLEV